MSKGTYEFLFDVDERHGERVFFDASRVRRARLRRLTVAFVCMFLTWGILFLGSATSVRGLIDELFFWHKVNQLTDATPTLVHDTHEQVLQPMFVAAATASPTEPAICEDRPAPAFAPQAATETQRVFGHVPSSLAWAPLSLASSCGVLDVLIPDWISIKSTDGRVHIDPANNSVREAIESYRRNAERPPVLMPSVILDTKFDTDRMLAQLRDPETLGAILRDLLATAEAFDAVGLCLDFKQLDERQLLVLDPVFEQISTVLRDSGRQACIVLSEQQKVWSNQALTRHFDNVILKAFREPWIGSPPWPLAHDAWFEELAERALAAIGPERLTLAIGNFAVEWTTRRPLPKTLPYAEAMIKLADADANLTFSPQLGNSFSSYRDDARGSHKLWLLDAASAHNQLLTLKALGVRNVAIWSLGREDPGLWSILVNVGASPAGLTSDLAEVRLPHYVAYRGEGAFLRITGSPQSGLRQVDVDPVTGRISAVSYTRMPRSYMLERYGRSDARKLVLTFDDGPDRTYTSAILDSLKQAEVPAAFFVVGTQVMEEPDLLNRMIAEGHEVGSHTFSHPRMDQISHSRSDLEHGMMSKLIAGYSGHNTILYREPFLRSGGPIEESRVHSLVEVQNQGGIIAGMEIVPKDWEGMPTDAIVKYVIDEVKKGVGNVILLHDGGQDRGATVAAVPLIINELRALGYEFTTLADLLGIERAALMPSASGRWLLFDWLSFEFLSITWLSLETIFWAVLAIGFVRMLIILALAHMRCPVRPIDRNYEPKVTVVIPAFNEEKVISNCIQSVLASDYGNFDVVVVDDGSQDRTFDAVLRFRNNPRVHILAKLNSGKWSALNAAVAKTKSEFIMCIDADTQIDPAAIGYLARQFANPRIGAVAGKITVGNRKNLLTRLQALEYITSQNFDRSAYDLIDGMLVVPGAIGAWRTAAIVEADLFSDDTMAEDADLTITINRLGYRVTYEERAIAYTEAPDTVSQLLGQRLRWSLGMFQCAWKHKSAIREGRALGLVSIPDMLIFGYLFPLLAPIADIFVLFLLYNFFSATWSGEVGTAVSKTPSHLLWAYMILPLLDLVVAAYALKSDKHESLWLLWLFPFQRFFYRQLLYLSVYRAALRAITGSLIGWGRLRRTGQLTLQRSMP